MWHYSQSTGELRLDGVLVATGYAGRGKGKNNPQLEAVKRCGPIPRGRWLIGVPYDSAKVGKYALPLEPAPGTDALGRSAFRIHGDSRRFPGTASEGCIIVGRAVREAIVESREPLLVVSA